MTTRQKLQVIQVSLEVTQAKLADRFGVTVAAFNRWWNEKAVPRPTVLAAIDDLYLEVTGEKIIPVEKLIAKKKALSRRASDHRNVIAEILKNPDIRDEMILKLTYHSNSIEGSTLTEPDTASILFDDQALPEKTMVEHLEAKNHQTALNYVFDCASRRQAIDEAFVLRIHAILMNGIQSDAGAYRRHAVRIVGANVPTANWLKISDLMPSVVADAATASSTSDILALCAAVHARFEQIHPFSDGNGRVGRLLMVAMLLAANHAPAVVRQQKRRLYYTYLRKAQTHGDHSQLEDFLCDAVGDGFNMLDRKDVA
jgi:Fic family protein